MTKKLRKTLTGIVLAGALFFPPSAKAGEAPVNPKVNGEIAQVVKVEGKPTLRGQFWVKDLPFNSDTYGLWESCDATDFYKFRLSSLPIKYKSFEMGAVIQHVDGTNFESHDDLGFALRLSGKINPKIFGKIDLRYFPKEKTIDGYGFITRDKVFLDCVSSYNHETGSTMFVPGIDYKINPNLSFGIESKFTGEIDNLDNQYTGVRLKLRF
jgi:hypothetical protein